MDDTVAFEEDEEGAGRQGEPGEARRGDAAAPDGADGEGSGPARKRPNAHLFERLHRLDGARSQREGEADEPSIDDAIDEAERAMEDFRASFESRMGPSEEVARLAAGHPEGPMPEPTEWRRLWREMEEREEARRDAEERAGEGDETAALGAWEEEGKPRHPIDALIADMDDAWNESLEEAARDGALAERARLLRFARIYSAIRAWWRLHGDREGGGHGGA